MLIIGNDSERTSSTTFQIVRWICYDPYFAADWNQQFLLHLQQPLLSLFKTFLIYFANFAKFMLTNYIAIHKQKANPLQVDISFEPPDQPYPNYKTHVSIISQMAKCVCYLLTWYKIINANIINLLGKIFKSLYLWHIYFENSEERNHSFNGLPSKFYRKIYIWESSKFS